MDKLVVNVRLALIYKPLRLKMKLLIVSTVCMALMGCASTPVPKLQELQDAYYGNPVSKQVAEATLPSLFNYKDPQSAIVKCSLPIKGWMQQVGDVNEYGYIYICRHNGKNSYGAYVGDSIAGIFYNGSQGYFRRLPSDRWRWDEVK